jgi:cell division protein FtsI/penicillin-binding protein 2
LAFAGLHLEPSYIRRYPERELFGPVVGLTRWLSVTGVSGIEGYYKAELTGRDPKGWEGFSDSMEVGESGEQNGGAKGKAKAPRIADLPQVTDGADLHTTLDRNVQRIAYDALANGVIQSGAERGLVIVMEPSTGKIRAVANYPSFDPNRYPEYWPDRSADLNDYSVSSAYEPGSVVKVMTVAAAVDAGLIGAETTFQDTGEITIGTETIHNLGEHAYGTVNTVEVLAYSLNVEAVAIAKMLQPAAFYDYMRRFGFGESTRIDLAGEAPGELRVPGELDWNLSDLGTNSYGQGVTATPILVLGAVSVVANGGRRMQPYVVERIVRGGQETRREPQVVCAEVISPQAATEVSRMLAEAVEMNIPKANVPGYTIAGKSGTSQVVIGGTYHPTRTVASFAGFGPIETPRFAILVKLDTPRTGEYGAVVAAPVFSRVAAELFAYYGIAPS